MSVLQFLWLSLSPSKASSIISEKQPLVLDKLNAKRFSAMLNTESLVLSSSSSLEDLLESTKPATASDLPVLVWSYFCLQQYYNKQI